MLQRCGHGKPRRFHNCRTGFQICRMGRKMGASALFWWDKTKKIRPAVLPDGLIAFGGFPTAEKTPAICHKSIDESLQSLFPTIHPSRF